MKISFDFSRKLLKLLAKILPYNLLFDVLYWKITKTHNLKENSKCEVCTSFFKLREKYGTT